MPPSQDRTRDRSPQPTDRSPPTQTNRVTPRTEDKPVKIRLNTELGGHKTGDTIDVTPGVADALVGQGMADIIPDMAGPKRGRPSRREQNETDL